MKEQDTTPPMNREQRRAEQFGRADNRQDNLEAESVNQASAGAGAGTGTASDDGGVGESHAGRPDQDVTRLTGAGAGGAIESDDRLVHHEGMHLGNQPNS